MLISGYPEVLSTHNSNRWRSQKHLKPNPIWLPDGASRLQSTLKNHLPQVSTWTSLAGSMLHLPALEPLCWGRGEMEQGKRMHFLEERNSLLFQCWGRWLSAVLLRRPGENDIHGVWPVIWGADQGPACSVVEIQTVLGPDFSRRHEKLSGRLDKDAKDYFIPSSNRGKSSFKPCPRTAPSLAGPSRAFCQALMGRVFETIVTIWSTSCKNWSVFESFRIIFPIYSTLLISKGIAKKLLTGRC